MMKPSPPNRPTPSLPLERNADADALGGREKRVLLRDEFPADVGQMNGNNLAGIRRAERDPFLLAASC